MASLANALNQLDDGATPSRTRDGAGLHQESQAVREAAQASPAMNQGEQPTPQAPLLQTDPPQEVQDALRELVRGYELESDAVRRHKVRIWRESEEFWRGNQNIWYSARDNNWHAPSEPADYDGSGEPPRLDYTINLFRPWGLSIIAALTQAPPTISYVPASAESQDDIATAKAANRVAQVVTKNNNLQTLRVKKGYCLWTQGIFATYTRFVVDGGQFGFHEEPELAERELPLSPAGYHCDECGGFQPATESQPLVEGGPPVCNGCGAVLTQAQFQPAQSITATVPVGTRSVPNGAEKFDVYGPLYFKVPPQAQSQRDCYYLILVEEQHKAVLRAAYPQKAGTIDDTGAGAEDTYERIVRLSLADAQGSWNSLPMSNLVTYKRAWLRPESFWAHADASTRAKLLELYPDGVRVEFAGDVFLQAAAERLDDFWVICTGLPGQGIYRDPLGLDAIAIQRQINDSANILAEHRQLSSAPPVLYDARFINGDALVGKRMQPASYVPVTIDSVGPQKPLADMIYQPRLGVDPALWNDGERLAETGQFITGALPSMFGGGAPNLKTAAAYAQSRDQAMGRLTLIWKQMRESESKEMTLAIECFRRNRTDDVELVVEGKDGAYRSDYIRLSEIRGNVVARPDAAEDFPQSFTQIRDALTQIMQTKDPELLDVIGAPVNRPIVQHYLGLPDLVDPADDNRGKQYMEIEALMQSEPIVQTDGTLLPSIAPDLYIDDHDVHIDTIKDWAVSDGGLQAKAAAPRGYANVTAHLLSHMDAKQRLAADLARRKAQVGAAGAAPPTAAAPPPPPSPPSTPENPS